MTRREGKFASARNETERERERDCEKKEKREGTDAVTI